MSEVTAYRCCPDCAGALMRFDPQTGEWGCACGVRTMLPGPAEPPLVLGDAAETVADAPAGVSVGCRLLILLRGALGGFGISIARLHCGGVR